MKENVLILGATNNPSRYAYLAAELLSAKGYPIFPVGIRKGEVFGTTIINNKEVLSEIDTVTLYIGPRIQQEWEEYILKTKPRRVIFNPGTENADFENTLQHSGIKTERACTLVLLRTGGF